MNTSFESSRASLESLITTCHPCSAATSTRQYVLSNTIAAHTSDLTYHISRKLINKQKVSRKSDRSLDQDHLAIDLVSLASPSNHHRSSKSFLSPARMATGVGQSSTSGTPVVSNNRPISNLKSHRNENYPYSSVARESVRKLPAELLPGLKGDDGGSTSTTNGKKRVIVFKKFLSKSPESNVPVVDKDAQSFGNAVKLLSQLSSHLPKMKAKISLNQMITLRKVKTTANNGILKRMLHAPSLTVYDLQVSYSRCDTSDAYSVRFRKGGAD